MRGAIQRGRFDDKDFDHFEIHDRDEMAWVIEKKDRLKKNLILAVI